MLNHSKEGQVFSHKKNSQRHESSHNGPRKDQESTTPHGGTEILIWNRCSYQVPEIIETNFSTQKSTFFTNQQ